MNGRNTVKRAPANGSSSPNANRSGKHPPFAAGQAAGKSSSVWKADAQISLWTAHALPAGLNRKQPQAQRSYFAVYFNERIARSGRSFRAPDQALESKDEGIYLWRTQWYLHRRSPKNPQAVQRRHAL